MTSALSRPKAETGNRLLAEAVQLASVQGLYGLTLGALGQATSTPKSSILGHFLNKEALQLAIVNEAERMFIDAVVRPTEGSQGLPRLRLLLDGWLASVTSGLFRGGDFLAGALHEVDGRPGPVRDRLNQFATRWQAILEDAINEARARGELGGPSEALVFRIMGIGLAFNITVQLGRVDEGMQNARDAIERLIQDNPADLKAQPARMQQQQAHA